jgi:hypothetical protein
VIGRSLLAALVVLLPGCSEPGSPPADDRCPPPLRDATPVAEALGIGFYGEDGFELVADGQMLPIVLGFQGGYMLTPAVRVDAARLGTDGRCVLMDIEAEVAGGPKVEQHYEFLTPHSNGEAWLTDTIPLFLSADLNAVRDKLCTITATWRDDELEARSSVSVQTYFDPP